MPRAPLPPELEAFLAEANPAVIATARRDGHPHAVPTWYEWRDGRVLVNMDESRSRLDHMRRDPRVAITILGRTDWYSHVSLLGRVVELRTDDDLADIDRLSLRYRGEPYWNRERRRVTALVEPDRWFTWGNPAPGS
jgi:PPOX class probable F420-dependent enzyme